jgi:hypothetical protein
MTQPEASAQNNQNTTTSTTGTTNGNPNAPNTSTTTTEEILYSAFRQKTIDMKHWVPLPDSMPSVRCGMCLLLLLVTAILHEHNNT